MHLWVTCFTIKAIHQSKSQEQVCSKFLEYYRTLTIYRQYWYYICHIDVGTRGGGALYIAKVCINIPKTFFFWSIISYKCSPQGLSICFRRQCVTLCHNESLTNQSTMTSKCLYIYFQHHVPTSSTSRLWYPWSDYQPAERRTCQRNLHATWTGLGFAPKVRLYNLADLVKN